MRSSRLSGFACFFLLGAVWSAQAQTADLSARGYAVIPTPQKVQLLEGDVVLDGTWTVDPGPLGPGSISARSLRSELKTWQGLDLATGERAHKVIRLRTKAGGVRSSLSGEIDRQAYRMAIQPDAIEIVGNDAPGLFYGVQTLLQLVKRDGAGRLVAPLGNIEDWPRLELRVLHWDTKHHQDRMETLKRYLDWSARFKVNMIGFELEDKFEYPSHPIIGAPGAFTTKELQELVDYGLERYIQIVPQIQAPAHMSYVLKHDEFRHLRADGSNYMVCTCDPRSYDLIFSMYRDAINATRGVKYFFVSTDEVYYAGLCSACKRPYNPENRSLEFVEFVQKAHEFLQGQDRKMLIWAESPLLPEHVKLLPPGIIDGEGTFIDAEKEHGIREMIYQSMQGAELLFPDNLTLEAGHRGHLDTAFEEFSHGQHWRADPIGSYAAAWDDSGLHGETFWLGWSAVARWGWNPANPGVEQHVAEFMRVYYGPSVVGMDQAYRLLQAQARAWERTWDRIPSKVVLTRYGGYFGKGLSTHRTDMTLPAPLINDMPDWFPDPFWADRYKMWISEAKTREAESRRLIEILEANIGRAERNQYNLRVLLGLAEFIRHHWRLFTDLERAEEQLKAALDAGLAEGPKAAAGHLFAAYEIVKQLEDDGDHVFANLTRVFEESRYPKGRSFDGRKPVHVFDDVKDHFADRRVDLSYMAAPEDSIGLPAWLDELKHVIRTYTRLNNVPSPL